MVHIALPVPVHDWQKQQRPAYYATTGIPLLLEEMQSKFGCTKGELIVNLFGGAMSRHIKDSFNIGKKNIDMAKQVLAALQLNVAKADVGGRVSRTVSLDVSTGIIQTYTQPLII